MEWKLALFNISPAQSISTTKAKLTQSTPLRTDQTLSRPFARTHRSAMGNIIAAAHHFLHSSGNWNLTWMPWKMTVSVFSLVSFSNSLNFTAWKLIRNHFKLMCTEKTGNRTIIQSNPVHFDDDDEKKMVVSVSNCKFTLNWIVFFSTSFFCAAMRCQHQDSGFLKNRNSFTLQFNRESLETTIGVTTATEKKTRI